MRVIMWKRLHRWFPTFLPPPRLPDSDEPVGTRGEFKRTREGLMYFAMVWVSVEPNRSDPTVRIEDLHQFEPWKQAAIAGVRHALWVARRADVAVIVHRILGTLADTTPATVAAAAANSVWKSLGYTPTADAARAIEAFVFGSFSRGADAIPDLPHGPSDGA